MLTGHDHCSQRVQAEKNGIKEEEKSNENMENFLIMENNAARAH